MSTRTLLGVITPKRAGRPRPNGLVAAAMAFLFLIVLAAILAPVIAPHDPDATDILNSLAPPSPEHWMGTDDVGRDTYSRLLWGAQLSLLGPLFVTILTTVIGTLIGLFTARIGGWVDLAVSRCMDIIFAFPSLLLALLAVAVFGPGLVGPVWALAIAYIPFLGRLVRAAALSEQAQPYVASHRVMGFSSMSITVKHVLPNIGPMLLAQATLVFGYSMLDMAALSYLGLGVRPPAADWGSMIADSQSAVLDGNIWSLLFPGVAVLLTVLAVNVIGESLSDRLDPATAGAML